MQTQSFWPRIRHSSKSRARHTEDPVSHLKMYSLRGARIVFHIASHHINISHTILSVCEHALSTATPAPPCHHRHHHHRSLSAGQLVQRPLVCGCVAHLTHLIRARVQEVYLCMCVLGYVDDMRHIARSERLCRGKAEDHQKRQRRRRRRRQVVTRPFGAQRTPVHTTQTTMSRGAVVAAASASLLFLLLMMMMMLLRRPAHSSRSDCVAHADLQSKLKEMSAYAQRRLRRHTITIILKTPARTFRR